MTRQLLWRASIVALTIGAAATASGQTEELVRTIPMAPGGQFTLSNIAGDITVAGNDDAVLTLRATKRLVDPGAVSDNVARDALDRVEIEIRDRGGRVAVEAEYPRRGLSGRLADLFRGGRMAVAVDYAVTVPPGVAVAIESVSGSVTVEGVDGETSIETISGDVRLSSLPRLAEVEMVSGDLLMTDVGHDDDLSAAAVSGRITIDGVRAPRVDVEAVSATIVLTRVEARRVDVATVSGPVSFDGPLDAEGRYELESHSGSIRVTVPPGTGFDLEAESFSGSLSSNATIALRGGGEYGDLAVRANSIAIDDTDPDNPTVEADAPLIQWSMNRNGTRELEGTVGGGGARLELSTFSGDMTIVVDDAR